MGRYPGSVRFDDSLKFYKAPLEEGENADAKKEVFAVSRPPLFLQF